MKKGSETSSDGKRKSSSPAKHSRHSRSPSPGCHSIKFVEDFILNNSIAIFSKTWCPFCTKVKDMFEKNGLTHAVLELDLEENGAALQKALLHISGQKTVPNVFINNRHVGGYSNMHPIVESGVLDELFRGMSIEFEYDLVVVGGGSGGLALAVESAQLGKKVALCDFVVPTPLGTKWGLGGTCVNVGCIPKKLMHRAAILQHDLCDAADFGWTYQNDGRATHNWELLISRVQNHIKSLNFGYRKALMEKNIKYFNAFGSFIDKHTLNLKASDVEDVQIKARNFVIAVGGRPKYPNIDGAKELCITSDDIFSMKSPPGKTLIIGASYVALECAGFLVGLGYDTTVMVRSVLLRGFDQQMAARIEINMINYGVKFVKNCVPTSFEKDRRKVTVRGISDGSHPYFGVFDTVLLAVGREPCTSKLNLAEIGIEVDSNTNKIITDEYERTSVSNIFAIGDVALGRPELTPVAVQAGKLLAHRLYNMQTHLMDYKNVPTTVFTPGEYGCVGYSEEDALLKYGQTKIEVYHAEFEPLETAIISHKPNHPKCYAKLIALKEDHSEYIIGAHILAPNAGEVIQGFALGIKMGATKAHFDDLVGIHPTIAEIFTTLDITKSSGKKLETKGC